MAPNIKNKAVEDLLEEIVKMTDKSKTETVRKSLEDRRRRLAVRFIMPQNKTRLSAFLQDEIWPQIL